MRSAVIGLLLSSLCLVSCDDDANGVFVHLPDATTAFGLRTLNGQALPVFVIDSLNPQFRHDVVSGTFIIGANRAFTRSTRLRETRGLVVVFRVVTCSGTFTRVENSFTFFDTVGGSLDCDGVFTGVVAGDVLSTTLRGRQAIYSR